MSAAKRSEPSIKLDNDIHLSLKLVQCPSYTKQQLHFLEIAAFM